MRHSILAAVLAVLFLMAPAAAAEEIKLKDGTVLRGHTGARSDTSFYFVPDDDTLEPRWIPVTEIDSIRFDPLPVPRPSVRGGES
jgi:hypothetical protein